MKILHHKFPCVLNNISSSGSDRLWDLVEEFSDIFQSQSEDGVTPTLRPMKGGPEKIHFRTDIKIKPTRCTIARKVPINFEATSDREVEALVQAGVMAPYDKPSAWISPAAFIVKPDGKSLRLIVDLRGLNRYIERPVHPFPTVKEVTSRIPSGTKYYAKFDAVKGYFQIPIDEESQPYTCFILPQGRFIFLRAPMGLNCANDWYTRRSDLALAGIPGVHKIVDDILVYAQTEEEFYDRIRQVFSRCRDNHITLSKKKIEFGPSVHFAGFLVDTEGVKTDPEKLRAVSDFPIPSDITGIRSFLGLANQMSDFMPDLAQVTKPMRELLKKNVAFSWGPDQQSSFQKTKDILLASAKLAHYDQKRESCLLSDASRLNGLGFALLQFDEQKKPQLIQCGSRSLSSAEKGYATIELELLSIVYAILKCKHFLLGSYFKVVTDHAPLKPILGTNDNFKPLDQLDNPRIQRLIAKISGFSFYCEWIAGKRHLIADALSRFPVFDPFEDEEFSNVVRICRTITRAQSEPLLDDIRSAAIADEEYRKQFTAISTFTRFHSIPKGHPGRELKHVWGRLSLVDDLIVVDAVRIFVPRAERQNVLKAIHVQHCGYAKTYALARQLYYWPSLKNDLQHIVDICLPCQRIRQSRQAEKHIGTTSSRPWEKVSSDLFHYAGRDFAIVVDYWSGYPFVLKLTKLNTATLTSRLFELFCAQGFPVRLRHDDGPQFRSEFKDWCKKFNINEELSSAYHSASNGHAEAGVKQMKYLLEKYNGNWDHFLLALLEWRNTSRATDGKSPAQMFFGARQRTLVPCLPSAYDRISDPDSPRPTRKSKITKEFESFEVGDFAWLQHPRSGRWDTMVEIVESRPLERSYIVRTEDGAKKLRNRRFLRKIPLTAHSAIPGRL